MSRRALVIALFASVAVNLFAIGAVVGGLVIAAHRPPVGAANRPGPALWAAGQSLPPEHRRAYRQLLREQGRMTMQHLHAARAARRAAWEGMARDGFDPARTKTALDQARLEEMTARGAAEHRIVDFAARLPGEERVGFAQGLARAAPAAGPMMMRPMVAGPGDRGRERPD